MTSEWMGVILESVKTSWKKSSDPGHPVHEDGLAQKQSERECVQVIGANRRQQEYQSKIPILHRALISSQSLDICLTDLIHFQSRCTCSTQTRTDKIYDRLSRSLRHRLVILAFETVKPTQGHNRYANRQPLLTPGDLAMVSREVLIHRPMIWRAGTCALHLALLWPPQKGNNGCGTTYLSNLA